MSPSQLPVEPLRDRLEALFDEVRERLDEIPRPDHTLPGDEPVSLLRALFEAMAEGLMKLVERIQERLDAPRPEPK